MKIKGYVLITKFSNKLIGCSHGGYFIMEQKDFALFFSQNENFAIEEAQDATVDIGEDVVAKGCEIVLPDNPA
jgi:hypothetical protein